ncbi:HD-GYP domain-containing protein [Calycomorphotria hydatis]|uniref:Cyclic di-GMP phosphodiesterase response regulator RpfG n=1 Tax=Calycomorphotria hydatis TaxID=2528027 RepID=A0A517T4I3_9PLAN|nr:HD domain-containing phosphohydrolase [Calycomorphotria hydatis]QDT63274.1 Cyclic di-GMP phosphodiesterase response regulator RpfG [Calycomorphotria hydatis]
MSVADAVPNQDTEDFVSVRADQIRLGERLNVPILDSRDVLLLAKGQLITPEFMEKLQGRGIDKVKIHKSEFARIFTGKSGEVMRTVPEDHGSQFVEMENESSCQLDELCLNPQELRLPPQGEAVSEKFVDHGNNTYDANLVSEWVNETEESVHQVKGVFEGLLQGKGLDTKSLVNFASTALNKMTEDFDLFNAIGLNPDSDEYPARHSTHCAMLAASIGAELSLDEQTIKELIIGCLVHDAGMMKIKQEVFRNPHALERVPFLEITKHPIIIFDMMKEMRAIPQRSAFIAYQMHERCDGSGYPRQRDASQIHFLSKIAAVADVMTALVSPRPHRPGLLPYKAVEHILQQTRAGKFDPMATRALLRTTSLFPLGSGVLLSDQRRGRVIRANGDEFTRPIIEAWDDDMDEMEVETVNLLEDDSLKIIKALDNA